ncbi:MAG: hypothetical protein D6679_10975 [Candidatus Hydrogenedentota bacterium]|nr:MAG: hypothetical protein D6679_10975 [Candidatus Hydrogenedentota bacterium]
MKCWDSNGREPFPHKRNARQGSHARRGARPEGRRQDADERRANLPFPRFQRKINRDSNAASAGCHEAREENCHCRGISSGMRMEQGKR